MKYRILTSTYFILNTIFTLFNLLILKTGLIGIFKAQLIANLLHNPVEINLAKQDESLIKQHVYTVDNERKNAALIHLIKTGDWQQVLVFASAKNTCNRLVLKLQKLIIHVLRVP